MKDKPIILVADDEPKNIELIKARLMPLGYETIEAVDGEDAINKVKEFTPDLILLDVMMPKKNGFEVCRILKTSLDTLFIPIIIVTALSEREDRIKGIEAGADDFLSKPIDAQELIARVKSLLRIKTQRDEIERTNRRLADVQNKLTELTKLLLKTAETRFKVLFESSSDALMTLAPPDWRFTDCNQTALKMFGVKDELEFVSKASWEWSPERQPDGQLSFVKSQQTINEAMKIGKNLFEWRHRRLDGEEFSTDVLLTRMEINGEKLLQATVRDITERKKIEAQLFQAQKLDSIGTLAGGVAHDFNNIIAAIKGFAELSLMEIDKANPLYDYLNHIVASTDRGANLTRQLLLFSRNQSVEFNHLNLNENVNNMLKMLARLIGEDIKIETKFIPDISTIKADAGNIEQVLMNLVINARDAMPKGGLIKIETENLSIDEEYCRLNIESRCGDFVCLIITDTGIGMTKEVQSHIFEPFYTTKPQGKSTGLGLAVVYGIVKKHNGWINVYSEPGQGAVFKIYLPASTEKAFPKSDTKIISPAELKGKGERILVVEDDEGIRQVLSTALAKMNYIVFPAANGAEARKLFEQENRDFRLILSDVVLPDINGVDLYYELAKSKPGISVLLSSGYAAKGEYGDVISARSIPFIQKPYNFSTLFQTIRDMLESN